MSSKLAAALGATAAAASAAVAAIAVLMLDDGLPPGASVFLQLENICVGNSFYHCQVASHQLVENGSQSM
jgi:hypothetical protein